LAFFAAFFLAFLGAFFLAFLAAFFLAGFFLAGFRGAAAGLDGSGVAGGVGAGVDQIGAGDGSGGLTGGVRGIGSHMPGPPLRSLVRLMSSSLRSVTSGSESEV
jgi:hypothetical protein